MRPQVACPALPLCGAFSSRPCVRTARPRPTLRRWPRLATCEPPTPLRSCASRRPLRDRHRPPSGSPQAVRAAAGVAIACCALIRAHAAPPPVRTGRGPSGVRVLARRAGLPSHRRRRRCRSRECHGRSVSCADAVHGARDGTGRAGATQRPARAVPRSCAARQGRVGRRAGVLARRSVSFVGAFVRCVGPDRSDGPAARRSARG
jgi:hypothetical protein